MRGPCGSGTVNRDTWGEVQAQNDGTFFDMDVPRKGDPGDFYRLCWASDPSGLSDYLVEIDPSGDLVGPELEPFQCTLGVDCSVTLTGYGLEDWNAIMVIE